MPNKMTFHNYISFFKLSLILKETCHLHSLETLKIISTIIYLWNIIIRVNSFPLLCTAGFFNLHIFFLFFLLFFNSVKKEITTLLVILFKLFCLNDIRLYHWRLNYTMRTKQINIPQGKKDLLFQVNCKVK